VHKDWEYRLWTDKNNLQLVNESFPEYMHMFNGLVKGLPGFVKGKKIRQADTIRYMILYKYGGVYADLDMAALKPLDPMMLQHEIVLGQEPLAHAHLLNKKERTVCNAIMSSVPGHPFWLRVLKGIQNPPSKSKGDPVDTTGPRMLERVLLQYMSTDLGKAYPVWVAPAEVLYPVWDQGTLGNLQKTCKQLRHSEAVAPGGDKQRTLFLHTCDVLEAKKWKNAPEESSLTVHHWAHTWLRSMEKESITNVMELMGEDSSRVRIGLPHAHIKKLQLGDSQDKLTKPPIKANSKTQSKGKGKAREIRVKRHTKEH